MMLILGVVSSERECHREKGQSQPCPGSISPSKIPQKMAELQFFPSSLAF